MEPETILLMAVLLIVIAALIALAYYIISGIKEYFQAVKYEEEYEERWSLWAEMTDLKGVTK